MSGDMCRPVVVDGQVIRVRFERAPTEAEVDAVAEVIRAMQSHMATRDLTPPDTTPIERDAEELASARRSDPRAEDPADWDDTPTRREAEDDERDTDDAPSP